jgi:hypothetical protein
VSPLAAFGGHSRKSTAPCAWKLAGDVRRMLPPEVGDAISGSPADLSMASAMRDLVLSDRLWAMNRRRRGS